MWKWAAPAGDEGDDEEEGGDAEQRDGICSAEAGQQGAQEMSEADRKIWSGQINALKAKFTGGTAEWMSAGSGGNASASQISRIMAFVPRTGQGTMPTSADLEMVVETKATAIPFHLEDIPLP